MTRLGDSPGLLGDTAARDYSRKLALFNAFAEPELRGLIHGLHLKPGMRVLDAGCGTGEALGWFADAVGGEGMVAGVDLATAHTRVARDNAPHAAAVIQADVTRAPWAPASFDLVWSVNTLNHLEQPVEALRRLATLVRAGGRVALGQSSFLPDMCFAWDARLEQLVNDAVRAYYRDRYGRSERDLAAVRSLVGVMREAGLRAVTARTVAIDRVSPLGAADEAYVLECLFQNTWGERLRPYLPPDDFAELARLCDPAHVAFALRRPDFHFLQTFTLVTGEA
jgi:SAM-dependent methyltransferase